MTHHTLRSSAQRAFVSLACLGLLLGCGEQLDPASLANGSAEVTIDDGWAPVDPAVPFADAVRGGE